MEKNKKIILLCVLTVGVILAISLLLLESTLCFLHPQYSPYYVDVAGKIYSMKGMSLPEHLTYDPETGFSLIPSMDDRNQAITTDKYGFRTVGRSYDSNKKSIIFLGGSGSFGWGSPDSDTFVYKLAQKKEFENFNVINMSVPGYFISNIAAQLKHKVKEYNPMIVFIEIAWPPVKKPEDDKFNGRDIDHEYYKEKYPIKERFNQPVTLKRRLTPRILLFLRDIFYRMKYEYEIRANLLNPKNVDYNITKGEEIVLVEEHVKILKDITQALTDRGVEVVFYIHPRQYMLFSEKYKYTGKPGLDVFLNKLNAIFPGDFIMQRFSGRPLYVDQGHLTKEGHFIFFQYFDKILHERLLRR